MQHGQRQVGVTRRKAAAHMLKAIHARKSREACVRKAEEVAEKAGVDAARGGREEGARRVRRNAGLHRIPARALAPDQDEQRNRTHRPRDQEEDEGRRNLPGRQLGPHTGDGEAEVHSGARVGQEEVPGHVQLEEMDKLKGKAEG